ncbi:MAG: manganese efflux pump [Peptococcaceae bacterium]|nr:manganese efflux pump [Peptococcaceae bacterium]
MDGFTLLAVAVALGTDAFSLAVGMGLNTHRRREIIIFPLLVALLHVFMPLTGMLLGHLLGEMLGHLTRILGGVILMFIGVKGSYAAVRSSAAVSYSFRAASEAIRPVSSPNGRSLRILLGLAVGVSFDALSVGLGLGTIGGKIVGAVLIMGFVAGIMTWMGLCLGKYLGARIGQKAELLGGLILVLIGLKIIV